MTLCEPVAVSGLGCICAAGMTLDDSVTAVFGGLRSPGPPVRFSSGHAKPYPVFEITQADFPPQPNTGADLSRTACLAIKATTEALDDAGWSRNELRRRRVGVCIGTTVGSAMNNEDFYYQWRSHNHPDMLPIKQFLNSNPAACIAAEFDLSGPFQTVVNACSSGADAIGIGASWIRSGLCDAVIAGGADELCRVTYNGFIALMITDASPCRPFDADRKGLNLGEGAAILMLESGETLAQRNKSARAHILGYGSTCDAFHLTAPHPKGRGLRRAVEQALSLSNAGPEEIAFVHAHGTATRDNDQVESKVLNAMLPGVPFLSTKGLTGHTLGAAGAISAALSIAFLERKRIPASVGCQSPDPQLAAAPVCRPTTISGRTAITEALAFGGNNAVLVFSLEP